jgi:hypothetical protein
VFEGGLGLLFAVQVDDPSIQERPGLGGGALVEGQLGGVEQDHLRDLGLQGIHAHAMVILRSG